MTLMTFMTIKKLNEKHKVKKLIILWKKKREEIENKNIKNRTI